MEKNLIQNLKSFKNTAYLYNFFYSLIYNIIFLVSSYFSAILVNYFINFQADYTFLFLIVIFYILFYGIVYRREKFTKIIINNFNSTFYNTFIDLGFKLNRRYSFNSPAKDLMKDLEFYKNFIIKDYYKILNLFFIIPFLILIYKVNFLVFIASIFSVFLIFLISLFFQENRPLSNIKEKYKIDFNNYFYKIPELNFKEIKIEKDESSFFLLKNFINLIKNFNRIVIIFLFTLDILSKSSNFYNFLFLLFINTKLIEYSIYIIKIKEIRNFFKVKERIFNLLENFEYLIKSRNTEDLKQKENVAIKIDKLEFSYPESSKKLFNKISLDINFSDKLVILGKNNSGKTTFLRILSSMLYLNNNYSDIIFDKTLKEVSFYDFQKVNLDFGKSIINNILSFNQFEERKYILEKAYRYSKELDLETDLKFLKRDYHSFIKDINQLSVSTKNKIEIIKVLVSESNFLIFNKPFIYQDRDFIFKFFNILKEDSFKDKVILITDLSSNKDRYVDTNFKMLNFDTL